MTPQIPQYGRFELCLKGPETGNAFTDVTLHAVFHNKNSKSYVEGFYDGNGEYRVRFMPLVQGEWSYETSSNVPQLDGQNGGFTCVEPKPGTHGPVRVHDRFHFAYADGTPFYPVGTTAYNWTNQAGTTVAQTLQTLAKAPFNKIRMSPFPKHYLYNANEPLLYPFEGGAHPTSSKAAPAGGDSLPDAGPEDYAFDFSRLNPAFFRDFEQRIEQLDALGIQADIILFHPYDRWGFSAMPEEANQLYLHYMVARLASYPNVWWSMANEWDLFRHRHVTDWEGWAATVVACDPAEHLRSIHNCIDVYDHSRGWVTHVSWQRVDLHSHVELTAELRERWQKPIVVDEIVYEGDLDQGWGNITGEELTRRFWEVAVRGGYCTHGETYLREDGNIWWAKGGQLIGTSPDRIAFLRRVMEQFGPVTPNDSGNDWDLCWGLGGKTFAWVVQGPGGEVTRRFAEKMICYFGFMRPRFRGFRLPEDVRYRVYVLDTWEMQETLLPDLYSGHCRIDLPGKTGIALRFEKVD